MFLIPDSFLSTICDVACSVRNEIFVRIDTFFSVDSNLFKWTCSKFAVFSSSSQVNDIPQSSSQVKPEESKLDPKVAKFISLICNVSMMAQHMMEIG